MGWGECACVSTKSGRVLCCCACMGVHACSLCRHRCLLPRSRVVTSSQKIEEKTARIDATMHGQQFARTLVYTVNWEPFEKQKKRGAENSCVTFSIPVSYTSASPPYSHPTCKFFVCALVLVHEHGAVEQRSLLLKNAVQCTHAPSPHRSPCSNEENNNETTAVPSTHRDGSLKPCHFYVEKSHAQMSLK